MLTEDPHSPAGERRMGMSINVAVLGIICSNLKVEKQTVDG